MPDEISKKHLDNLKIPGSFPAPMWDQMQYLIRKVSDQQVRCVIKFDGHLDHEVLKKAVTASLIAEPVLRCRFVERDPHPCWEYLQELNADEVFEAVNSDDENGRVIEFLAREVDPLAGPQIKLLIIRSGADTLCINMSHPAGDAGGIKDYVYLLSSLYRRITENGGGESLPNLKGDRGLGQVFNRLSFKQKMYVFSRSFKGLGRMPGWGLPLQKADITDKTFLFLHLPASGLEAVKAFGRRYGATVNDVILTACFRALHQIIQPGSEVSKRLFVTVDLRRYIPSGRAGAICNLSSAVYPDIGCDMGRNFEETLHKVTSKMNQLKAGFPGLAIFPLITLPFKLLPFSMLKRQVWRMMQAGRKGQSYPPGFTNMGIIDESKLVFPGVNVINAYLTGAVNYPPSLQLGFSSFKGCLTFSICSCGKENRALINHFLQVLEGQLPG